jgi:hypothetical protein
MTIITSVKVRDGLVLATDSMTQIQGRNVSGESVVIKTYSNAKKLFQVPELPMGVMSYGVGNIGPRSIQGVMREFYHNVQAKNVKDVATALLEFIKPSFNAEFGSLKSIPELGFFIAGYSQDKAFADEWEFLLPRDREPISVRPETTFGASWRGIWPPFTRLFKGYDTRIEEKLREQGSFNDAVEKTLKSFEAQVVFDGMPVQDAVNFAVYIVQTTVGMSTFEVGPPICGGPLQVATILPDSGFEWVLNPKITIS